MLFSKIIKKKFDAVLGRYEGDPALNDYTPADFPRLKAQPLDLPGDRGVLLKGSFYYAEELNPDQLVVFDHGIGAGHYAYLKEIEQLVQAGYTVYSYDHTGCACTGGPGIQGFGQGVNDLDHVLTALQKDARFAGKSVRLVGHSWGGYSAMNAAALHPEVTHVVSLAGFLSAQALEEQYLPKPFLRYSREVMDRERAINPAYADLDARESLKKSKAKLLHLQSRDDQMVEFDRCYTLLEAALKDRPQTVLLALEGRGHDPQYSDAACAAKKALEAEMKKLRKHHGLDTPQQLEDFRKTQNRELLHQQDPEIWHKILTFLAQ